LIETKKKKSTTTTTLLVVLAATILALGTAATVFVSFSAIQNNSSMAYPQQRVGYYSHSQGSEMKPGEYAAGSIASLQNNQNGNPTWIVSGYWKGGIIMNKSSSNTNTTSTNKPLPTGIFGAMFNMVMLNGSAMHKHQVYNFTLTSISMPNNMTAVYNGTATITMKEGPVHNVPISIRAMNDNTISIWVDPTKTNNHFGNTPIFGTILKHVIVKK
jgi:hypothetical protein